jgi:hypothetical protein
MTPDPTAPCPAVPTGPCGLDLPPSPWLMLAMAAGFFVFAGGFMAFLLLVDWFKRGRTQ